MSSADKAAVREAWASYICPGRPQLWQWACSKFSPHKLWGFSHIHPSALFPGLYPHRQPPEVQQLYAAEPAPQQQPPQEPCAVSPGVSPSTRDSDGDEDSLLLSGSSGRCCCSECVGAWHDSSPDSQPVRPGKRIKWSGAIIRTDPVRRNLFPALQRHWLAGTSAAGQFTPLAVPAAMHAAMPAAERPASPAKREPAAQPAAAPLVPRRSQRLQPQPTA